MKAKTKPLEEVTPASLGVDMTPHITVVKMTHPPARKAGIKVADVPALMDKLKNEARAI